MLSSVVVFSPTRAHLKQAGQALRRRPACIGTGVDYDIEADAAAVEAASPEYRDEVVELFLARYESLWTSIARKYSRSCGVRRCDLDDAAQAVRIEAYKLLLEGAPPGIRWGQALWRRSEEAIRELSISGGSTGFSGMTGHERRRRSLEKLRSESGLSGAALLEAWNAKTAQTRSNPKRQGAIASEEDLVDHKILPNGTSSWDTAHDYEDPVVEQLLGDSFTADMEEAIVQGCSSEPPIVGRIAHTWFTGTMTGSPLSCAEIARRIGTSRTTVQRAMPRVMVLVREIVADRLVSQDSDNHR